MDDYTPEQKQEAFATADAYFERLKEQVEIPALARAAKSPNPMWLIFYADVPRLHQGVRDVGEGDLLLDGVSGESMASEPQGEYARWVVERPERLAAIRAYLDMLDVSDDKREDMLKFTMIVMGLARL